MHDIYDAASQDYSQVEPLNLSYTLANSSVLKTALNHSQSYVQVEMGTAMIKVSFGPLMVSIRPLESRNKFCSSLGLNCSFLSTAEHRLLVDLVCIVVDIARTMLPLKDRSLKLVDIRVGLVSGTKWFVPVHSKTELETKKTDLETKIKAAIGVDVFQGTPAEKLYQLLPYPAGMTASSCLDTPKESIVNARQGRVRQGQGQVQRRVRQGQGQVQGRMSQMQNVASRGRNPVISSQNEASQGGFEVDLSSLSNSNVIANQNLVSAEDLEGIRRTAATTASNSNFESGMVKFGYIKDTMFTFKVTDKIRGILSIVMTIVDEQSWGMHLIADKDSLESLIDLVVILMHVISLLPDFKDTTIRISVVTVNVNNTQMESPNVVLMIKKALNPQKNARRQANSGNRKPQPDFKDFQSKVAQVNQNPSQNNKIGYVPSNGYIAMVNEKYKEFIASAANQVTEKTKTVWFKMNDMEFMYNPNDISIEFVESVKRQVKNQNMSNTMTLITKMMMSKYNNQRQWLLTYSSDNDSDIHQIILHAVMLIEIVRRIPFFKNLRISTVMFRPSVVAELIETEYEATNIFGALTKNNNVQQPLSNSSQIFQNQIAVR
jgi:hypothetical protein